MLPNKFSINISNIQCSRIGESSFEMILPGGMRVVLSEQWFADYLKQKEWEVAKIFYDKETE